MVKAMIDGQVIVDIYKRITEKQVEMLKKMDSIDDSNVDLKKTIADNVVGMTMSRNIIEELLIELINNDK